MKAKVIDAFIINDETALLDLRMRELDSVVDVFVAVESPLNFRGQPKPMHIRDSGMADKHEKLEVFSLQTSPQGPHPTVEWHQRRALGMAWALADPGDIVLMGDVDEIPDARALAALRDDPVAHYTTFRMHLFYGSPRWLSRIRWYGTVAHHFRDGDKIPDCQKMRNARGGFEIVDAGWHLSWFGGQVAVARKLADLDVAADIALTGMTHRMHAPRPGDAGEIEAFLRDGQDLFGRGSTVRAVNIDPGVLHPQTIGGWLRDYPEMMP